MRITTLGALAVDGRPVRGERLAAVVRELVGARGRTVSVAALVDAVWDGGPPDDAAGAVQALISRVRRLGLAVAAVPGGYRLPAEDLDVDAVRAREQVERGQAALRDGDADLARGCADAARALFPEVPELAGLDEVRLLAEVAALRAGAALAGAGTFDEADLRRLAAHAPPDEPSAALLMRVLAAQGREAEALEFFERLRAELAERYGTDPSPMVTRVQVALLRGELAGAPRRWIGPARALPVAWRRPATALIGRDEDVAAVTGFLHGAQLVTVVAVGGAGKTRLAAEVARQAAGRGQAVHVVELAGLRDAAEVLPALLAAISVAEPPARPEIGTDRRVRAAAQDLEGLVVLDNCEHLLDGAAAAVAELLAVAPPDVTVLATSRAPLSLPGEVVHRLRTLPDDAALGLLKARALAGGAALPSSPATALELCHRLDNLPLALELAAARLRHMPIEDVLAGLTDRFGLLDDALRGLPDRHAGLWAMVDWSRELLGPGDRDLLQRLSVIPAPFTAEAAAPVAGVAGQARVRRGLATLVEQSLLVLEAGGDGRPRYRILETVREYGEVRLDAAAGRAAAMAGLVAWARGEAATLAADAFGPGQLVAIHRCATEQDNLVAALRWAITHEDEAAAIDLAVPLFHLWTVRGLHPEVIAWARTLLRDDDPIARRRSVILHGTAAGGPLPDADRITWVCLFAGLNSFITGTHRLFALARQALRTLAAQRPGAATGRSAALTSALTALAAPDHEIGVRTAARLIAYPDPYVQGYGYFLRANVRENRGDLDASAGDIEQAYRRFETAGDHWGMGMAAQSIGTRGDGGSGEWLRRGERHMRLVGATQDAGSIRVLLDVQLALGGDADAVRRLHDAAASPETEPLALAQANLGLAQVAWLQARHDDALAAAERAVEVAGTAAVAIPQVRVIVAVVAAVLHLRVAAASSTGPERTGTRELEPADARAAELLTLARGEAIASQDVPALGSWALGGAALAAHRGDSGRARELWVLGSRCSANAMQLFQHGHGERLAAALGTEEDREPMLAAWRNHPVTVVSARIHELMEALL